VSRVSVERRRRRSRKTESVAPIRAFCTSAAPKMCLKRLSVQKNFDAAKPRRSACFSCVNALRGEELNICASDKPKTSDSKEMLVLSALL
jgi:hypothetical protein